MPLAREGTQLAIIPSREGTQLAFFIPWQPVSLISCAAIIPCKGRDTGHNEGLSKREGTQHALIPSREGTQKRY